MMKRALRTIFALTAVALLATPRLAAACAMCMAGVGGATQRAFAIGSIFLSVTPLAAGGAMAWYIRRRAKAIEREASERRAAAPEPAMTARSASR